MRTFKRGLLVTALAASALAATSGIANADSLRDSTNTLVPTGTTITATGSGGVSLKLFGVTVDSCANSSLTATVASNSWSTFPTKVADIQTASFTSCASGTNTVANNLPWALNATAALSSGQVNGSITGVDVTLGGGLGTWTGNLVHGLNGGTARWLNPGVAGNVCAAGQANIDLTNARNLTRVSPTQTGGAITGDWCVTGNSAGVSGIKVA